MRKNRERDEIEGDGESRRRGGMREKERERRGRGPVLTAEQGSEDLRSARMEVLIHGRKARSGSDSPQTGARTDGAVCSLPHSLNISTYLQPWTCWLLLPAAGMCCACSLLW